MSTRLSKDDCEKAKAHLLGLLNHGLRFIECPLTDEEKGIFWHKGFPDDLLDAYVTLNEHGVGVEYGATTRAIGFVVEGDSPGKMFAIRLSMVDQNRGFFTITRKMMDTFAKAKLKDDKYTQWPRVAREDLVLRLGQGKFDELLQWARDAATMDEELQNAVKVLNDIFGMIKTAGQLRRMVPELFQYLPPEQRASFEGQKRVSTLPFEWTPYPRDCVEKMITTVNKCHLLHGMAKPSMAQATLDSDQFSWASLREEEPEEEASANTTAG